MKSFIPSAFGALMLTLSARAQSNDTCSFFFTSNFAGPFTQNETYLLAWNYNNCTDGAPTELVSLDLGSGNNSQPIVANLTGGTDSYEWTVPDIIPGGYYVELVVGGALRVSSEPFNIVAANSSATVDPAATTDDAAATTVTYTAPCTSGTGAVITATPYTYYDHICGCTKTAIAPVPAATGVAQNYTSPAMTTANSPVYTGGAGQLAATFGSGAFASVLLAVAFIV